MRSQFQPKDLLESLVRLEQNGESFYRNMAKKFSDDKESADFFTFLADQETHHEALYKKLSEQIDDNQAIDKEFDDEYKAYIQNLIDQIFNLDSSKVGDDTIDIYRFAIGLEKDTILFIKEVKSIVPDFEPELLDKVEAEERGHIKLIQQWYDGHINGIK